MTAHAQYVPANRNSLQQNIQIWKDKKMTPQTAYNRKSKSGMTKFFKKNTCTDPANRNRIQQTAHIQYFADKKERKTMPKTEQISPQQRWRRR